MIIGGRLSRWLGALDWLLLTSLVPLLAAGLVTMRSFTGEDYFFSRQLLWAGIGFALLLVLSSIDFRFLRRSGVVFSIFLFFVGLLVLLLLVAETVRGARSWFAIGDIFFQPGDLTKLALILLLAKYFSRRHVEIANIRHIIVSGLYALVPFILILAERDFGSASIIFLIWLGMTAASGIPYRYLVMVLALVAVAGLALWFAVFTDIQKARIVTFVRPLADVQGAGYNARQAVIAVGSGGFWGKGLGEGTQSRLKFLPEYQTDFIFAAFAEEWGFAGVAIFFVLFGMIIWRVLATAMLGATNFEMLFGLGLAIMLISHFMINVGMNIGLLPITGLTLPFMSYGGSHLLAEFVGLGILAGMRRYSRAAHRSELEKEFLGGV